MPINPKVSVVLTSYNHAKFIGATIESILAQSFKDFELIILDNVSDDNSLEVINSFKDDRIVFVQNPVNMGMVLSVNKGISLARGEYIAHMSSDDIWFQDKLEKQVNFLDENQNFGAVFTKAIVIDEDGNTSKGVRNYQKVFNSATNKNNAEWLEYFFNSGNNLCYPSALIRKICYEQLGAFDARYQMGLDMDVWVKICSKYDIHVMQEQLMKFRSGSNSTSSANYAGEVFSYETENILYQYLNFAPELFSRIFAKDIKSNNTRREQAHNLIDLCLKKGGNHINLAFRIFNEIYANPTIEDAKYINQFFKKRIEALNRFKLIKNGSTYKIVIFIKGLEKKFKKLRFWK